MLSRDHTVTTSKISDGLYGDGHNIKEKKKKEPHCQMCDHAQRTLLPKPECLREKESSLGMFWLIARMYLVCLSTATK